MGLPPVEHLTFEKHVFILK